jgi:hypothetical protein
MARNHFNFSGLPDRYQFATAERQIDWIVMIRLIPRASCHAVRVLGAQLSQ